MKITLDPHYFSDKDVTFILGRFKKILQGKSFLTQFKYCEEFEKEFAKYIGTRYAVSTNSGTSSIEIILRALELKNSDIVVPTNTFAATAFAVLHSGNKPVFADCWKDLTLDPDDIKKRLTNKTKAIITVHIGGLVSPRTTELKNFCQEREIYLIEDAAHAHGSMLDGKKAGSFGIANSFSFFSTKIMTTGEGGMITTDDERICNLAKELRDQAKIKKGYYQNYHERVGYNWRMLEVSALLGLTQLKRLDEFIKRRNEIARIYNGILSDVPGMELLKTPERCVHNYYKYIAFLHKKDRLRVQETLKTQYGIGLSGYVYEIPLHKQPVFSEYAENNLPVAEDLCSRHICLPFSNTMKDEEAEYIAGSLKEVLKK